MHSYPHLFSPLIVKSMVVRNRIFMPPMGSNLAQIDGTPSPQHEAYYALRAQGGAGLITVENVCIDFPLGTNGTTQLRFDNDQYLPGFFRLVEGMHAHGACVSVQINHAGSSAWPGRLGGLQPVSASAIPTKSGATTRPLTVEEIYVIVKNYGEAALRAKRAGCDCVEIHAGHMYLLSQFFSPLTNHRTDEFGGSRRNRARFAALVAAEIRRTVGPAFPVVIRVSADEMLPGGNTMADTLEMLESLIENVDIINVSAGLPDSIEFQIDKMSLADGWRAHMAKEVRERFGKPVVTSGNIRDPQVAERLLAEGFADLIAIGRGLIADPFWPAKVHAGKEHLLRRCISCNIGCADNRIASAKPLRCTVNPDIFHADPVAVPLNPKAPRLLVVGGGVGGLEAACTAAEAGCRVDLLEKGNKLGGLARRIAAFPAKYRIKWAADDLENRAKTLPSLEVKLNTAVDLPMLERIRPDMLVLATGATPFLPPIAGLAEALAASTPHVHTIFGLMDQMKAFAALPPSTIVVVGGGAVGLDVVEFFAESCTPDKPHTVRIVEMLPTIGRDLDMITRNTMLKMLKEHGVEIHVNTRLERVSNDHLDCVCDGQPLRLDFDHAFICLGMRAADSLPKDCADWCAREGVDVLRLGDAKMARRIIDATREGRELSPRIGNQIAMR